MPNYLNDAVQSLMESISFDSSLAPAQEGMPFGKGAKDCLLHFLSLAEEMGFETKNYESYVGEVIWGEGKPFAILAHLDVVPAGNGWNTPPFEATLKDGKIFGRGAMDDKGPAIASLYAMKMLKEEGFSPNRQIKLIVGCNEECGWACIDHYKKVAVLPEEGFSPDANFPVIYAEKGIAHVAFRFPVDDGLFATFQGGERTNMVCDLCRSLPVVYDEARATKYGLTQENGMLLSRGKSAHGSTPEEGKNAIEPMLKYYSENKSIARVLACLFDDEYGLKTLSDETGNLTMSPDVVTYAPPKAGDTHGELCILTDIRYPATLSLQTVNERLSRFGVPFEMKSHQPPLYHDKNSPLIRTLSAVYNEYVGEKAEPIAIGGGTYARALQCGVAFGPEVEGEEVTIHQPNEYITLDRLELMLNVYKTALERLTK